MREIKLHNKAEARVEFLLKFYSKLRLSLTRREIRRFGPHYWSLQRQLGDQSHKEQNEISMFLVISRLKSSLPFQVTFIAENLV